MAAAATTTGTLSAAMQTFYDNTFLSHYKDTIVVMSMGQQKPVPNNSGKTIDFFRYHPYAKVTSSVSNEGQVGNAVATRGINSTATIAIWKNHTEVSEFLRLTSRDKNLQNISALMGQNAGESLDAITQKEIATFGATYIRADMQMSYQFEFTCGGTPADSSTTATSSGAIANETAGTIGATDDLLIGGVITFLKNWGYGQSRIISDSAATRGVLTWVTALDETLRAVGQDTGTKQTRAWFCQFKERGTDIPRAANGGTAVYAKNREVLTGFRADAVHKATEMLEQANAPKFPDGLYHGAIDPKCKRQLMKDSEVLTYMQHSRPNKLERNMIGEYGGVMWFLTTAPQKLANEGVGSTKNTIAGFFDGDARITVTWVFGQNAFGVVELTNRLKKINVKTPGPHTVSSPNDEYSTVGWKAFFIPKALNATHAIAIVSHQA